MLRALIVAGNSLRFHREANKLRRYLVGSAAFPPRSVRVLRTAYRTEGAVLRSVREFVSGRRRPKVPKLIAFLGHGTPEGWSLSDDQELLYSAIAEVLRRALSPCLLVNDCCHSAAVIEQLKASLVDEKRIGVIAACAADATTLPGTMEDVLRSWRSGLSYAPRERVTFRIALRPETQPPTLRQRIETRVREILHAMLPERFPEHGYIDSFASASDGISEMREPPPQTRWGAKLDESFFPRH